jgi:hypothetical protein
MFLSAMINSVDERGDGLEEFGYQKSSTVFNRFFPGYQSHFRKTRTAAETRAIRV